ncbi:MAG: transposase [Meiothermus sp.]|nr:transposase [Meiothermus sp.]
MGCSFLHKLSTELVQKYDGLCIENLSLEGMARTKLSKSVLDAALGEFRRQLEYKAVWHRKHLVVVDRFFPSSKLCPECGTINQALTLSDRVWTCECGAVHDRDLNAARNIRAQGMGYIPLVYGPSPSQEGIVPVAVGHTETLNAWGAAVRPASCRLVAASQESHSLP